MVKRLFDVRNNLIYLLIVRWAALVHVAVLLLLGLDIGSLWLFAAVIVYVLLLSMFWSPLTKLIKSRPFLLQADLFIAAAIIWATGGGWKSPYYIYAFTSLMVAPFFSSMRYSLASTAVFCLYYTAGLFINDEVIIDIAKNKDVDTLLSNYVAFALTVLFFGHPANVIKGIERTVAATSELRACMSETNALLDAARCSLQLTNRELEIYSLLCKGKGNAEIAETLFITEKTVKNHLYKIYKKLGVHSRSEAIIKNHSEATPVAGEMIEA